MGKPDDLAFVVDSWVKYAFRKKRLSAATKHVRTLLGRDGSFLRIAHVPDEPNSILGWVAYEGGSPPCVHYVYVRSTAREGGVARALLGDAIGEAFDYSTQSKKAPPRWTLNLKRAET